MTALAGLWRFDGRPDAAASCTRMLASQEIYGPHAASQWSEGGIALGRRLMRLLPEDVHDRQPLVGGGGRYVLVADLRLDNRDELIRTLNIAPDAARRSCDAAILLAAIEKWEESCLEHIVGDYAFVLWDGVRRALTLARDPLGRRPLHYYRGKDFFAFASMPKGLHALAEIPYAPDEERIAEYLMLMPESGPRSFFLGIERIELGHSVTVTANGHSTRRHWQPKERRLVLRGPDEYAEALREQLDRAVASRLRGTAGIATHLSSGLDSAAVTATAARLLADTGRPITAFTAVPRKGYDGPIPANYVADEGPGAAKTAALYPNIEHVLVRSKGISPLDDLDRTFFLFERPVLNICNLVWTNAINDAARERKLQVMLVGSAGNAGLSREGRDLLPQLVRNGRWLKLWREGRALTRQGVGYRTVLANSFGPWCPGPLWEFLKRLKHGINPQDLNQSRMLNPSRAGELAARARAQGKDIYGRPRLNTFADQIRRLQMGDPGNYIKGTLGGWQIDQREPLSDARLIEFCMAVPREQFLSGGVTKALARRALADRLPKSILDETRSGLQSADWHESLTAVRGGLASELDRLEACTPATRALNLARMRQLVNDWPRDGWERRDVSGSYRWALLRGISTGHFLRRAAGTNG